MADEAVRVLDAEALAAVKAGGAAWCSEETFYRLVATLEALQRERDEWKAAYQEVINGHS